MLIDVASDLPDSCKSYYKIIIKMSSKNSSQAKYSGKICCYFSAEAMIAIFNAIIWFGEG